MAWSKILTAGGLGCALNFEFHDVLNQVCAAFGRARLVS